MQLSENARRVLEARYLRRNTLGKLSETPDQLFARVACAIAHAELLLGNREHAALWEECFHTRLTSLGFLAEFTYLDECRHAAWATLCLFRVAHRG